MLGQLLIRGSLVQAHPEAPKKESCKSMIYGTFLFLIFQSCTQFAPVFKQPSDTCTHILAELTPKGFCKRLSFLLLSSSNVDKLKTSMEIQLSTTLLWVKSAFPSKSLLISGESCTFAPTRTRQASQRCLNRRGVIFLYR